MIVEDGFPVAMRARLNWPPLPRAALLQPLLCEFAEGCGCPGTVREGAYGGKGFVHRSQRKSLGRKFYQSAKKPLHSLSLPLAVLDNIFVKPQDLLFLSNSNCPFWNRRRAKFSSLGPVTARGRRVLGFLLATVDIFSFITGVGSDVAEKTFWERVSWR